MRTTLRIGLAVLLSIAVGCTVGDRPARPPSASRTTTTATSADEGPQPDAGLLLPAGGTAHTWGSDWFNWPSYSRLRGGGCYAYQVDGAGGSRVVVFRA